MHLGYSSAAALLAKYGDEILQKKQDSVVNDKNENKFETKKVFPSYHRCLHT